MALISDVCNNVLALLKVLSPGDTPSAEDQGIVLTFLNQLLENWNTQGFDIFSYTNFTASLTGGTGTYSIGNGATFNTPRPAKIAAANVIFSGVIQPLKIVGVKEWSQRDEPALQAQKSKLLYYDNQFPTGNLNLWPVPSGAVSTTLDLYYWEPLGDDFVLSDTFTFPPGYQKAITYNVAVDCQDIFGVELSQAALAIASSSKQEIQGLNVSNDFGMEFPPQAQPQQPQPQPQQAQ
jgi:hypothetical protein